MPLAGPGGGRRAPNRSRPRVELDRAANQADAALGHLRVHAPGGEAAPRAMGAAVARVRDRQRRTGNARKSRQGIRDELCSRTVSR
jgi:hypothetical protein